MWKLVIVLVLTSFLSSCFCTLQSCEINEPLLLVLRFEGFNSPVNGYIKIINAQNDSLEGTLYISENTFHLNGVDGRKFYIFSNTERVDSITNISFEKYKSMEKCNRCLIGKDLEAFTKYKNISYEVNGVVVNDNTEIIFRPK